VLLDAGIDVLDTNPSFTVTHEKSMVVDDATAVIGSLNWARRISQRRQSSPSSRTIWMK
jgi:phosphatidylserine/phosphatidylglycerophosphate/cardiolipin synthase-like enzyme